MMKRKSFSLRNSKLFKFFPPIKPFWGHRRLVNKFGRYKRITTNLYPYIRKGQSKRPGNSQNIGF